MVLSIHPDRLQGIRTHAESTYPDECCGLLLGYQAGDRQTVVEVWQAENVWNAETAAPFRTSGDEGMAAPDNRKSRYTIAPELLLEAQKSGRDRGLSIIGIYHSHPDHPAKPSEWDRRYAWECYSYIIVSVRQGQSDELSSWRLDANHQFQPEPVLAFDPD